MAVQGAGKGRNGGERVTVGELLQVVLDYVAPVVRVIAWFEIVKGYCAMALRLAGEEVDDSSEELQENINGRGKVGRSTDERTSRFADSQQRFYKAFSWLLANGVVLLLLRWA